MAQQNFFGQLYVDLSTHLKAAVPKLKWIDMDFGQLEHFEYKPEVAFPCSLVDFLAANYSNTSNLDQIGDVLVQIRLGFAPFSQSHQTAPLNVKEKALEYFTIEQEIYQAIQGWQNSFTDPFIRVSAATDSRFEEIGLRVRLLTFSTSYHDESAGTVYTKRPANLEIDSISPL
jgi:hypothetical protein